MKLTITLLALVVWAPLALASKNFQTKELKSESDDQSSLISILYKQGVPKKKVTIEEHGTFIQVKVPNTIVLEPGKFYDGNSPYYRKIATFQVDSTTAGIRMFVTQETKSLVGSISTEYLNDRLLIHLDHRTVKPVLIDDSPPVGDVIARTKVRNDIKDPALQIQEAKIGGDLTSKPELDEKLIYTTVISVVFLVLIILSIFLKRLTIKMKSDKLSPSHVSMKTLATHSLASKQKLTLVEVEKQKILLGVSPDGINFLTTIEEEKKMPVRPSSFQEPAPPRRISESMMKKSPPVRKTIEPIEKKVPKQSESGSIAEKLLNKKTPELDGVRTNFTSKTNESSRSIEDVTNLIRSKLKDLPTV